MYAVSTDRILFKRYNVIGTSGSGKTTFSRKLAEILDLPHIEMDALFWQPNWQESSDDVFLPKVQQALDGDGWVLDGNYSRTTPTKWANVECVVWLDYTFLRNLKQAVGRAIKRAASGAELWPGTGNRESFRMSFFSRDSVVLWTIQSHAKNRRRYEQMMADSRFEKITFVRLRSPQAADQFLQSIRTVRQRQSI